MWLVFQDPYVDPEVLGRFVAEVEKFEKGVESLYKHTLSGPTPLEKEWKVRVLPVWISLACIDECIGCWKN